ncbi:hypothetical protein ACFL0L_01345 [Patescibacteria group bacterium]
MDQAPAITPLGLVVIVVMILVFIGFATRKPDDKPKKQQQKEDPQRQAALARLYKTNRSLLERGNEEKINEAVANLIRLDEIKSTQRQGSWLTTGIVLAAIIFTIFVISTATH